MKHYRNMAGNAAALIGATLVVVLLSPRSNDRALAGPRLQEDAPTASQLIEAVNNLRLANGLPVLSPHPVLMQVAEWEVRALVDSRGASGHVRPPGMTLGQQLLALSYPLSGDLSLDGYRSENIIWAPEMTAQRAVEAWLGDDPHTNTMLSADRSDIGAAVASAQDEWGATVHYFVLETALQTRSGQMQSDAYPILTAIAAGQTIYAGGTPGAAGALPQQYIVPVARSTARSDGDVIHNVQYGQSLWSLAMAYDTTIRQIRAWNNLGEDNAVYVGQVLLVQKGATRPAGASPTAAATATLAVITGTPTAIDTKPTAAPSPTHAPAASESGGASLTGMLGVVLLLLVIAAVVAALMLRMPK